MGLSGEKDPRFEGRGIVLGVTGGIAAYKSVGLASAWTQRGARVRVLMTQAATRFVTPLTFQSVTRQSVITDVWHVEEETHHRPEHIDLSEDAEIFLVAPATADFLARAAHGFASDIVTLSLLAYTGPLLIAPAMNDQMWAHAAVQGNVQLLRDRGAVFIEPGVGHLACGSYGAGRLAELELIDRTICETLAAIA